MGVYALGILYACLVRYHLCTFSNQLNLVSRTWITIAMVDRKEHGRVTDRSLLLLMKTISLLVWGRKTWYAVIRDERGEVLDSEVTLMVKSLKIEFTIQVSN